MEAIFTVSNNFSQQELPAEQDNPSAESVSLNLQAALREHEKQLQELIKQANSYVNALKRWQKACKTGDINNMHKAMEQARNLVPNLEPSTRASAESWRFDVSEYLKTGAWIEELQAVLIEDYSMRTFVDENGNLICSPVIVRTEPAHKTLKIGKQRWTTLHPKVTAKELKQLRDRIEQANLELLEALYAKWQRHKQSKDGIALLRAIYEDLAETPGWKQENPKSKFGSDLYALHLSGITTTRKGIPYELQIPSGKYSEKDVFTVTAKDGTLRRYYSIWFSDQKG